MEEKVAATNARSPEKASAFSLPLCHIPTKSAVPKMLKRTMKRRAKNNPHL
jgi:hypothetical protein